ncbi:MAG: alpha/beta fold hydrolase [Candidatus Binatia bacterium]
MAATQAEERVAFPSRRGNRLVGILHAPATLAGTHPGVILCHGMESTKEGTKHRRLGEQLSSHGIATLRFDFSYVGESEGDFADLTFRGEAEDLGGAWDFLRERVTGPIGILGSSMGGAVALLFAAAEPGVRSLATIAAVAHPERIVAELRPTELERWRKEGVLSLGGVRLRSTFLDDVQTLDVVAACRKVRSPTFVAHGDADRVVPCTDAAEIGAALGGEHVVKIYPGADHRFSRPADLEAMLADCETWLERHLAGDGAA